jgi:quinol monooxygenase YgiN
MWRRLSMYGTIARIRIQAGREEEALALLREWERERRPRAEGAQDGYLFRPDREAGTAYLVAMFHDEASYRKNADDPEQDAWYQRFRALLEADPEWNDGIFESSAG